MKINEIKNLSTGTSVDALFGKVVKVGKYYSGTSSYGDYTLQTIVIEDDTGSIDMKCCNRKEVPENMLGNTVKITPDRPENFRIIQETYKGQTSKKLRIDGNVAMTIEDDGNQGSFVPQPDKEKKEPPKKNEYWDKKFDLDVERQQVICREHAISAAILYYGLKEHKEVTLREIIETASEIARWTYGGEE